MLIKIGINTSVVMIYVSDYTDAKNWVCPGGTPFPVPGRGSKSIILIYPMVASFALEK